MVPLHICKDLLRTLNIRTPLSYLSLILKNSVALSDDVSQTFWMSGKHCRPSSRAASDLGFALFVQVCLSYLG